ncbi:MAG: helix-turn-helix transcriptional regulator [Planctomycetaceae bacterium]
MRGSLPACPQLSWFGYYRDFVADRRCVVSNAHECIKLVVHVNAAVRRSSGTRETRYDTNIGGVGLWPADGRGHTFVITPARPARSFILLVPPRSIAAAADAAGINLTREPRSRYVSCDAGLRHAILDVADDVTGMTCTAIDPHDDRFHLLALRIVELLTGQRPHWHRDAGGFTEPILARLVARVDDTLAAPPSLQEFALDTGLSPGHFARKFRRSCGMSLSHFILQRRVRRALELIRTSTTPLCTLALDLGFESQSHFTRVFRALTGLTPGRFRRELRG